MTRWLNFEKPDQEYGIRADNPEAILLLEKLRLIGVVSLHYGELWFIPTGWNDAGLCWRNSWWNYSWVLRELIR